MGRRTVVVNFILDGGVDSLNGMVGGCVMFVEDVLMM